LEISEVRWEDFGEIGSEQMTFLYSGRSNEEQHLNGVGILLTNKAKESLLSWQPISDRIIMARFQTPVRPCTVIKCYAPMERSEMENKIKFYEE
jgi:exonuclease III